MVYTKDYVQAIANSDEYTDKQKISELLKIDSYNHASLGIESNKEERRTVKDMSVEIYKLVMDIDKEMGEFFIKLIDNDLDKVE